MARRFGERDIERWVERGIIMPDQRDAMLTDAQATVLPVSGGVDLTTLLYYGGGLLVLLAYSIFLGLQWEDLNDAGRIAISAFSLVFFATASQLLIRSERFRLPGELLQTVAVAIVPLLLFALLEAASWWPDDPGYRASRHAREAYELDLGLARMVLAGGTLIVAAAAFRWSRSPFVLAAAIISFTALVLDVTLQFDRTRLEYDWNATQSVLIAVIGAVTLAAGIAARGATERDYSLWLYIMGLTGLAVGLGSQALQEGFAGGWDVAWMAAAAGVLALSIIVQERLFAAAGLAAVFVFLAKLVFEVFESASVALALAALGLVILGVGILYQRYSERLFERPADS